MTKKERTLAMVVGIAAGAWALDRIIITPQLNARTLLGEQVQKESLLLEQEDGMVRNRAAYVRRWEENKSRGLVTDPNAAVAQLANFLNNAALESNLVGSMNSNSVPQPVTKPGGKPGEREQAFMKVSCSFTTTGSMAQISSLIQRIQNAPIPVRISDQRISSKQEGGDTLELFIMVSSIILKQDGQPTASAGGSTSRPAAGATTNASTTRRELGRQ